MISIVNILEDKMRLQKQFKNRLQKDNIKLKTAKMIEAKLEKDQFFDQVLIDLKRQFTQEHLDFLLQNLANTCHRDQIHPYTYTEQGQKMQNRTSLDTAATMQTFSCDPNNFAMNVDANLFQTNFKQFIFQKRQKCSNEFQKYACTPNCYNISIKKTFPKRLFEVDCKMRKNYERIKQRVVFNSSKDTFRASNLAKSSLALPRQSKTQRVNRYQTECRDSESQAEEYSIPRMLLGELGCRSTSSEERGLGVERRSLCFKRQEGGVGWVGRRHKFNH